MSKYFILLCLLFCLIAVGCNGNKRLSGKVTFPDGKPAPGGTVYFRKDNFTARGEIKSDGSYKVSSEKSNDGIPPGEYMVYVTGVTEAGTPVPGKMVLPVQLCDPKYGDPERSGLTCKVPAPGSRFDITLERNPNLKR